MPALVPSTGVMTQQLLIVMTSFIWSLGQCSDYVLLTCHKPENGTKTITVTLSYPGLPNPDCEIEEALLNEKPITIPENNVYTLDISVRLEQEYKFHVKTSCGPANCQTDLPPGFSPFGRDDDTEPEPEDNSNTLSGPMLAILGTCSAIFIVGMVFLNYKYNRMCSGQLQPRLTSSSSDMDSDSSDPAVGHLPVRDPEAQRPLAENSS